MCKDTLIDITAGLFVFSVLAFCTALFLTTLDGVACGPAAHPSPAWSARSGASTPTSDDGLSETSGVGPSTLSFAGVAR